MDTLCKDDGCDFAITLHAEATSPDLIKNVNKFGYKSGLEHKGLT